MGNISTILSSLNKNILNPLSNNEYGCDCRSKKATRIKTNV